ncbi:hypothetical protein GEMRC1_002000 [Eukaryota sp. GEM-RC1]
MYTNPPSSPSRTRTLSAPVGLLKKRYHLFEDFTDSQYIVAGVDKKSSHPFTNRPVFVKRIESESCYNNQVKLFSSLRSQYVANMLDHWYEEDLNSYFLVIERGGLLLSEKLSSDPKLRHGMSADVMTLQLTSLWLFLYSADCSLTSFNPSHFCLFGGSKWKIIDMESVEFHQCLTTLDFSCSKELAEDVVEGAQLNFSTDDIRLPILLVKSCFIDSCGLSEEERRECIELLLASIENPGLTNDCKNEKTIRMFELCGRIVSR